MKVLRFVFLTLICHLFIYTPVFGQLSAKDIFDRTKEQMLSTNFEMQMDIKTVDKKSRVKKKTVHVLMAKMDQQQKTKVTWLKPERANGTTVVISDLNKDEGTIEVYTPSNGKSRKMKATPANMKMVGSEFSMTGFQAQESERLKHEYIGMELLTDRNCNVIEVRSETAKGESRGVLWIEEGTFKLLQVKVYGSKGKLKQLVELSDHKTIPETADKIQAMHIVNTDYENKKSIELDIISIAHKTDFSHEDFKLPETVNK